jgi:hypothetical protein
MTYHLKSRFGRLREQGLLTGKEMAKALDICETTVHEWARCGLLRRIDSLHERWLEVCCAIVA